MLQKIKFDKEKRVGKQVYCTMPTYTPMLPQQGLLNPMNVIYPKRAVTALLMMQQMVTRRQLNLKGKIVTQKSKVTLKAAVTMTHNNQLKMIILIYIIDRHLPFTITLLGLTK